MENKTPEITADEIVNKSKQWTLEGDCTLLRWMEQISKNLEERATKTTSDLNELSTKLERTSIALSNATNSLAALQYTQFVENRVHDDDETLANVEEVPNPPSDVVDKSAADTTMHSFLKKNLEMMNSCHEAYAFSYDDSDEDEPATNVVYRSKNPYEARPLPHIYGTKLWKEKWHIGLCDSDTDFSGDENSEQFSASSSESDHSYESTAQTMSEWDSTAWGLNANPSMEPKQFRLPSNDGESYSQSEVSTPTEQRRARVPIAQPVQDQRYYQHVPRKPESVFDDIFDESVQSTPQHVAAAPPPVQQEKVYQQTLIPSEPPPDEPAIESESNKRTGAKKTLNLFDDDEFSSFMNQIVETAKTVKSAPTPTEEVREPVKKVVPNLFEDHDDLFGGDSKEAFTEPRKVVQPRVEEKTTVPSSPPKATARTKIRNLFEDDDDDDDDFEKMFAAKQSGSNAFLKKTTNLFENDSDVENDVVTAPVKVASVKTAADKEIPFMKKGLFDDEDDDIFPIEKPAPSIKKPSTERSSLFSDGEKVETAAVSAVEAPKEPSASASGKPPETSKTKRDFADLFQDEPPEDIFLPTPTARKTKVADIFADDFTDDFEEFLPKEPKETIAKVEKPSVASKVDFSDLFQDDPLADALPTPSAPKAKVERPTLASKVDFSDLFQGDTPADALPPPSVPKAPKITKLFEDDFEEESEQPKPNAPNTPPEMIPPNPRPRVDEKPNPRPRDAEKPTPASKPDKEQFQPSTDEQKIADCNQFVETQRTTESQDQENHSKEDPTPSNSAVNNKEPTTNPKPKPSPGVPSFSSLFPDEPPSDDDVPPAPTTAEKDAGTFSSINLFADVPPDDDFQVAPPTETKRIHSIFYDDFNETIEATREMRAPSNYIFNDEPPPDDDLPASDANPQPKVAEEKKEKEKLKVSKLKKFDLQINVGALLPTAKIPSFKKPEAVPQRVDSPPSTATTTVPQPPVMSKETRENRDLPENILPNLNKDRVKLGVKRRPSTRKGRQESYRKSLIETEAAVPSDEDSDGQSGDPGVKKVALNAGQPAQQEEVFATRSFLSKIPPFIKEEERQRRNDPPSEAPATSRRSTSLFEDFGDFGGGHLFGTSSASHDKSQPEVSTDPLFHDNEAVVNPFGTPKTTPVRPVPPTEATRTVSLFDDSDPPPLREELPPSKRQPSPPTASKTKSTKGPSLFEDSDDGSDDLFKEPTTTKKPPPEKPAESKPKKELVAKPVKASSSLFSSDEESESDDIFGKSKLKVPSKKIEPTKAKPSSSLFADLSDDDEDDLFGTSKKKTSSVDKSKAKPSTHAPTKEAAPSQKQQSSTTSYNPLSDLLDN